MIGTAFEAVGPHGILGLVAVPPPEAMMPASLMSGLVRGVTVKFITEGDADPQTFIPQMLDWYKAGKFPFDQLIKTFAFDQINEAAHASEDGSAIKPVLVLSSARVLAIPEREMCYLGKKYNLALLCCKACGSFKHCRTQRLNTLYEVRVRAEGLFAGANELSDALEA